MRTPIPALRGSKLHAESHAIYDKYISNPNRGRGNALAKAAIGEAKARCAGNPAAGIPVLEKALRDARISLPPRS